MRRDIEFHLQIARCSKNEIACKLMEIVVKGIPSVLQGHK